jgi:hypothetical protein
MDDEFPLTSRFPSLVASIERAPKDCGNVIPALTVSP